jgi:hypothetical protein
VMYGMCVCVYVCTCVCAYTDIYIYIYYDMCIFIGTHMHTQVQKREKIKQEAMAVVEAEEQRLAQLEEEAALRERMRHTNKLLTLVFRALATDRETGRAKDPKEVFMALDQVRNVYICMCASVFMYVLLWCSMILFVHVCKQVYVCMSCLFSVRLFVHVCVHVHVYIACLCAVKVGMLAVIPRTSDPETGKQKV